VYTEADIYFDPVSRIEDAEMKLHTFPVKYIRSFGLLGKSARVEMLGAYQEGEWDGIIDGEPRAVDRKGQADPIARFAVNLMGAPVLSGRDFAAYRAAASNETIIGTAVSVQFPVGEYNPDKLINLGQNRYVIRPQIGGVQTWGKLSLELDASVWFFTDNDDFYIDQTREQDPLIAYVSHVYYTIRPGAWVGVSGGYGVGGESTIGGVDKDDKLENFLWSVSIGLPINRSVGVKFSYIALRTKTDLGSDSDSLAAVISYLW